jgi:hypothetical protein
MSPYRSNEQQPPPPRPVSDVTVMRFDGIFEVSPDLMTEYVPQQGMPAWDTLRIAHGRHDHLQWMHDHFTSTVVSAQELLDEL